MTEIQKLSIVIPGNPIAQSRPRLRRTGKFVSVYDPDRKEKELLISYVQEEIGKHFQPIEKPISINITFHMPMLSTWSPPRKQKSEGLIHIKRPDLDNLLKYILDSLNGILYSDDSQIYEINTRKIYSSEPKTVICAKYEP